MFLDTAPLIYFLDADPRYAIEVRDIIYAALNSGVEVITSAVSAMEYLTLPYRTGEVEKIGAFFDFLADAGILLVPIDAVVAQKAAQIRAEYRHFKTMDALQLASACVHGCDVFLTNDKQLRHFAEINCAVLD